MKNFVNNKRMPLVLVFVLVILLGVSLFKNADLKYQIIYEKTIPDVELINSISIDSKNIVSGSVTGFVLFDNKEKQPRELRQYIEITATKQFDEKGRQFFYHRDIIKMNAIPPRYFDPVILTAKDLSGNVITLTDIESNLFFIDKNTREITALDATGDITKLITSESDFRNFMRGFLK